MNKQEFTEMAEKEMNKWARESDEYSQGRFHSMREVLDGIKKLDEPEPYIDAAHDSLQEITTLSQEDFDLFWNCTNDGVAVSELKQEEKVVIPQFVAEVIEKYKENDDSLGELLSSVEHNTINYYHGMEKYRDDMDKLYDTVHDVCETIARAWLDGFEVEKQPKYLVKVKAQGSWLYLKSMSLYKDVERRTDLNSNLGGWKEKAIKFSSKEQAESIAKFFSGEIEEVTEGWGDR